MLLLLGILIGIVFTVYIGFGMFLYSIESCLPDPDYYIVVTWPFILFRDWLEDRRLANDASKIQRY
jgi:hypothetical protein